MRTDILAIGSRGDVQPYIALGAGLRRAGHRVRMVTLAGFEELVQSYGLDHIAIAANPETIAQTAAGREWIQKRSTPAGFLRGFVRIANALIEEGIANYWSADRDAEALIVSPMGFLIAENVAERLRVPLVRAQLAPPVEPTRFSWDVRSTPLTAIQGALATFIDSSFRFLIWSKLRAATNAARARVLNLPALSLAAPLKSPNRKSLLLGAYSPAVAPRLPDWGEWVQVTGYWFLDELPGWIPPSELVDFLSSGPQPVFVGFGSTPFPEPEQTTRMIVRALERAGRRGVVVAGGSGLPTGQLSADVLSVGAVPHGWLFPRVAAAVHHGGAGVTGAALRAGLPAVVVPVFADQPFWGKRVFQLGAGPPPIPAQRLTEDDLTGAIQATANEQMRWRAAELGERIRSEDGIACAVRIIGEYLGSGASKAAKHQHAH